MASTAEELKAEEELLNETAAAGDDAAAEVEAQTEEVADEITEEVTEETTEETAVEEAKADPMEESHETDFDLLIHGNQFNAQIRALRDEKSMNDGKIVFASEGERKRITVLMSAVSSGSVKLMNSFYQAKRTMMEHGFFHTSIDLKLPQFAQPEQSTPETAVRSVVNYIYTGKLNVSPMSIKNITVLAAYLEMQPILDIVPKLATQMEVESFDLEALKKIATELPDMTVDGLKKFVDAGFGTYSKMRTGDKRKQKDSKKKEPQTKKAKVDAKPEETSKEEPVKAVEEAAPEEATAETVADATEEASEEVAEEVVADAETQDEPAAETVAEAEEPAEAEEVVAEEADDAKPVPAPSRGRARGRARRGRGKK